MQLFRVYYQRFNDLYTIELLAESPQDAEDKAVDWLISAGRWTNCKITGVKVADHANIVTEERE